MTMMGFIGIETGDRHILVNISRITVIEGARDGLGVRISYVAGPQIKTLFLNDMSVDRLITGLAQAAQSGIALPRGIVEHLQAMMEKEAKEELDS